MVIRIPARRSSICAPSTSPGARSQAYDVRVSNQFGVGSGVYIRGLSAEQQRDGVTVTVRVAPEFADDVGNQAKADFLKTFRLEAEDDWLQVPEALHLNANGRGFSVRIDARAMRAAAENPIDLAQQGGLFSSRVLLHDLNAPEAAAPRDRRAGDRHPAGAGRLPDVRRRRLPMDRTHGPPARSNASSPRCRTVRPRRSSP